MKTTYYICRDCGMAASPTSFINPTGLSPNLYQKGKITKHNSPSAFEDGYHSVFFDPAQYDNYGASTFEHGAFEIEEYPSGYTRINRLWVSGSIIGETYYYGVSHGFGETVKQVFPTVASSIHWFPVESPMLNSIKCAQCGTLLFE